MTADVELLPLYAELQGHPKVEIIKHYARACVEANTAPLQAEIEALRAEVAEWKRVAAAQAELHDEAEARAERMAEALQLAEEHIDALTPEWYSAGQRVLAAIRATQHQEQTT